MEDCDLAMKRLPVTVIPIAASENADYYAAALDAHGGVARVLRPGQADPDEFHGLLLPGGGDLSVACYGCPLTGLERKTLRQIEPDRERLDRELLAVAWARRLPVLGICRGCQMLNVFAGGTLIPDLPLSQKANGQPQLRHRPANASRRCRHAVAIVAGSRLDAVFAAGRKVEVNSSHHQAVHRCGKGLRVGARSADGVIEAVEDPRRPFWIGVQFHPERLWSENPAMANLFRRFVAEAQQAMRRQPPRSVARGRPPIPCILL